MEWTTRRRRGGGGGEEGVAGGAVLELAPWLLLLALAASVPGARGLDMDTGPGSDAALLLSFKRAVTADPLGVLSAWPLSPSDSGQYSPCAWNGVICNGFPASPNATSPPPPVNATSNSNSTAAGIDAASLAAAATTVSRVIGLVLPNAQLSGTIPAELALIPHLRHLDLSNNALNGNLPPALLLNASDLRILSLAGNDLSGSLPVPSSPNGSLLQELNISDNALSGSLPAGLLHLPSLAVLALANNYLAGGLPGGGVGDALEVLDLSDNYFEGALPSDFGGVKLRTMNVSSNRLTGDLPVGLAAVLPANATVDLSGNNFTGAVPAAGVFGAQPAAAYEGNPRLCGPPLDRSCSIPSSLSRPPNGTSDSPPAFAAIPKGSGRGAAPGGAAEEGQGPGGGGQGKLRPAAIVAIVAGDLAGVGVLFALFLYVYHVRKRRREHGVVTPPEPQQKSARGAGGVKTVDVDIAGVREDRASTSTGCCIGRGKSDGSESSDCSASSSDAGSDGDEDIKRRHPGSFIGWSTPQHHSKKHHEQQQAPAPATLVTVDDGGGGELEMETLLKASAYILGATGSSIVYKAVLADGTALAVRRIGESGGADRLKDFEAQVRAVARFRHPNVLRLRGFYWGADEKLLIHDYAANGSLANIAFTRRFGASSSPMHLSLEARLRIARGVARGLAYIHEKKGVHGNVKPSNILLSVDMEPWIGDLGLDRLVSGEGMYRSGVGASARLFGSKRSMHSTSSLPDLSQMPGGAGASPCTSSSSTAPPPYQAPECLKNLRPNAKWDVYSFGMVLLELLSGRVYSEVELCQWHAGSVASASATADEQRGRVLRMADPTLRGEADGNEDTLLGCFRLAFACCAMAPGKRPSMRDAAVLLDRMPAASTSTAETPY